LKEAADEVQDVHARGDVGRLAALQPRVPQHEGVVLELQRR
jgi:hypothetical protein